ncbi:putative RING finger protein [Lachnellula willkommii]|uniref:Putative RING finger protein n=1 Tax=Lachnellula willkommii TaxID=215461 RepID=A0A559M2V3_9HELO|nr:putative RING finger protein [Lachnellula willkommii]
MTSAPPNASTSGGKSLNISSHSPLQQHQTQVTSPPFDSSSRRSGHQSSPIHTSARNNQVRKKHHKNFTKPRLGNDDEMAESGAMRNANSRRGQTSITHLMNFTLPPRPQDYQNTIARGTRRGNIYGIGSGHHSSDKARYIHANYRFIVKPYGDYKPQAVNADQHLDWNDVLQILASSVSQEASCPICLSHPVAPRMAKCGHIFCLPCLIRYMHSTDDTNPLPEKKARWKKCPICWDSVYISDTKPVRWYTGQEGASPREGDDVVLRLVMRQPGSTLALPRDGADALGKAEDIPWYFAAEVTDYARIMKGSEGYMLEQYDNEIEELKRQENEDELMFGEEPEWTRKAVNAVNAAKDNVRGVGDPPLMPKQPAEKKPKRQPIQFKPMEDVPEMYFIQNSSQSGLDLPILPTPTSDSEQQTAAQQNPPLKPLYQHASNEAHRPDDPYFFYQGLLHYYLAPLDIRILKSAFGNFASFPSTLLPRVERVSTGHIMDDELRKRTKYLSHLPYGCEVGFLECNWTDVVAPEILEQFLPEIEKRRKRNRDKENREEKDRLRAEKAEDEARWATARRKRPIMPTENFSEDDFHPLASSSLDAANASPPWATRRGSSFASLASPSTSPSAPRTVWGTTVIAPASPNFPPQQPENDGDDGWLHSWEQELLAENELIAQVQATSLGGQGNDEKVGLGGPVSGSGGQQGKKKKAKKITLMSTNARRAA